MFPRAICGPLIARPWPTSQHFCDKTMDDKAACIANNALADAHGFDVLQVQNYLLEFSVKAQP